jgi:phosphohistidine phosphatase
LLALYLSKNLALKKIILLRHAKAEKLISESSDFERNLAERGKNDALQMAHQLAKTKHIPEYIIASPANRTKQTASIFQKELHIKQIALDSNIYEADLSDLIHVIKEIDDQYEQILLVGHNPSITGLVGYISQTFIAHIPTSGIVVVELPITSWPLIQNRIGKVIWQTSPIEMSF